jgi:hypothetical protein
MELASVVSRTPLADARGSEVAIPSRTRVNSEVRPPVALLTAFTPVALLAQPAFEADLAPLKDYRASARRAMRPAASPASILNPDSGPRITLPGPALPPELAAFQNSGIVTAAVRSRRQKSGGLPGWMVSLLVMAALLALGGGAVFSFLPRSNAETQELSTRPASHPLARNIEVTGIRLVVDFNKKSEIHYLVVNHSAAALPALTVYVTLRSARAQPGQSPVGRFSFRSPDLGPFESKEMTGVIENLTRSAMLPEWPDLRAEVQVAQ